MLVGTLILKVARLAPPAGIGFDALLGQVLYESRLYGWQDNGRITYWAKLFLGVDLHVGLDWVEDGRATHRAVKLCAVAVDDPGALLSGVLDYLAGSTNV